MCSESCVANYPGTQMALREKQAQDDGGPAHLPSGPQDLSAAQMHKSDLLLESVIRLLEVEDQTNPIQIVGLRASPSLMTSFFSVALAAASAGFSRVNRS